MTKDFVKTSPNNDHAQHGKKTMRYLAANAMMILLFCTACGNDARLTVEQVPDDAGRYTCDIKFATFKTPVGWQAHRSDKNTYAILTVANEAPAQRTRMISIDIGKPVEPTARKLAEAFAKDWNGHVEDEVLELDGELAYRVVAEPDKSKIEPIDCVVAIRDGRAFLLIAGAKQKEYVSQAIDELVASWKWK